MSDFTTRHIVLITKMSDLPLRVRDLYHIHVNPAAAHRLYNGGNPISRV